MIGLSVMPAAARTPAITVGEPEGFDAVAAEQTLLVDVFFGGVRRGEAVVKARPGSLHFVDVSALLALFPEISDQAAIERVLAAPDVPAHPEQACGSAQEQSACGRLSPEVAGVILDRDQLRLDVFLNPRLLTVSETPETEYLPSPGRGLSVINSVGALVTGGSGQDGQRIYVQDRIVLAQGTKRLRADVSFDSVLGFETEQAVFEWDWPEFRYSAGAFWSAGDELSGRYKLIGMGVETQHDTRMDKDAAAGSPIIVFLDGRARVELIRDGRILHSAIYEPGNQQVDTSDLPEGSYDVTITVQEAGRPLKEDRRFFAKSRRFPAVGRFHFFANGGLLVDSPERGSMHISNDPIIQAGAAYRLNRTIAIEGTVQGFGSGASAQVATTFFTPIAQVRLGAVTDLKGRYGGVLQIASSGTSRLNLNLDLRRVESRVGPNAETRTNLFDAAPGLSWLNGSFTQASGVMSFSVAEFRVLGVGSYRQERGGLTSYSVGPSVQWDFLRRGPLLLTLRSDLTATERGAAQFAGVSLRLLGRQGSLNAAGGARRSSFSEEEIGEGAIASLGGSWNVAAGGGTLAMGAGLDHSPRQDTVILSSEFHHPVGTLATDWVRSDRGSGRTASQFNLGLQTTIAASGDGINIAGKTAAEGMMVARVDGARPADTFELLVNEQPSGTIVGGRALTLSLPTYRAYEIRIRPTGDTLQAYDRSARVVGLYPGTINRLHWTVEPVTLKFGRLVYADGQPAIGALIVGKGVWAETDADGYFQIETSDSAHLSVTVPEGSFPLLLPGGQAKNGISHVGTVACCTASPVRLGANLIAKSE